MSPRQIVIRSLLLLMPMHTDYRAEGGPAVIAALRLFSGPAIRGRETTYDSAVKIYYAAGKS